MWCGVDQAAVVASMDDQEEGAEEAIVEVKVNYDYLLSMPINSLTLEKVHTPHLSLHHCILSPYPCSLILYPCMSHKRSVSR